MCHLKHCKAWVTRLMLLAQVRKRERAVSAIYDDEGTSKVSSEKRGHNFVLTAKWNDICVDNYDCVVVPGGRSPEFLVMNYFSEGIWGKEQSHCWDWPRVMAPGCCWSSQGEFLISYHNSHKLFILINVHDNAHFN